MDALSVVTQLRDLASEPQNREIIVKDQGCLPGLVLFLDHRNPDVLFAALQALRYLAELPSNIPIMKNELGMMVSLQNLNIRTGLNVDITALAQEVFDILNAPAKRVPERQKKTKSQFFINSSNKKAKSVTLHIQGLDSTDQRGLCEDALLKVKGVISFTFQMASKRCTVRIRSDLPTESLASAIAATKVLSAQQVVRNEAGEEVFVPLDPSGVEVQHNSAIPNYLPEEDEVPKQDMDKAVSRTNAKEDASGSWLSTAASFLSKSFYW
ncbi:armadillo repeat containing 1, like isoform X2 [Takifugu rubripes]|nr:armadillo repeat-containing protein 1-like isoform X2 [Takifugu rubripes]XP_011610299.2 armadillo repeat-containing protein 1-like isoform X2 [Takifugu rubripes]XP_011610300.2 armadillo repeat-containing protein 1-like isoform X2 [Takifugu rubripes]XP_056872832.1 armadillo repeat containing 1, like isoform X2 [Takifugu flavidus]XP_056872833.1 armadillo repeat containing 1, like isoform X2 [Takifugu flavidus]XP_056872835.1 armadillo repeat containing 1, like isoform X2 [Takifugu flavidus]TW